MSREDREKLQNMLSSMTIQELGSCLQDSCEGCEEDPCPGKYSCEHYESKNGVIFGPVQAKAELIKRQRLIHIILKGT